MRLLLSTAALFVIASSTCVCSEAGGIKIGAIRWDAWFPNSPWAAHIHDKQWVARLPFYGSPVVDISKKIDQALGDTTESEAAYAASAGIDYFAFTLYAKQSDEGNTNIIMSQFSEPLEKFLSLKNKYGMHFSLILPDTKSYTENASIRRQFASYVGQASFVRTSDGRPVVFLLMPGSPNAIRSSDVERDIIATRDVVIQDVIQSVGKQPFLVALSFDANDGSYLVKNFNFDAFSSYGNPLGSSDRGDSGARSFSRCANSSKYYWSVANKNGTAYIPPVSLGWDYRPVTDEKGRSKRPEWCAPPQGNDVRDLITSAFANARLPTFRSILIYAWNEFLEGGFLAPTLCDGASKLAGLAAATGREKALTSELAMRPLPRRPASCPLDIPQ